MGKFRFVAASHVLWILMLPPLSAQEAIVTDTQRVWFSSKTSELLRKINGRWWTTDNRLVYPPGKGTGYPFWQLSSKPGVVEFNHHRPFDVRRAEQLRLFMTANEVEAAFGKPNRRFAMSSEQGGMWYYHGVDGTILDLWFMERDELGQAHYLSPDGVKKSVASIETELGGRSIFSVMAKRASTISVRNTGVSPGRPQTTGQASARSIAEVEMRNAAQGAAAPAPKRYVARASLDGVKTGMMRDEVLGSVGEPTFRSAITGGDGFHETYTYYLDENQSVSIQLLNGKVERVR